MPRWTELARRWVTWQIRPIRFNFVCLPAAGKFQLQQLDHCLHFLWILHWISRRSQVSMMQRAKQIALSRSPGHHVYFLQFSLISVRPPHLDLYIGLWNLQIALITDVPWATIITLVLFGQSKAAYWYKIYVKRCIYKKLFRNRSQRTVRAWLNGNTMFYETIVCFYVSEAKPLCFSLCSQMFDGVEWCWICNIQNVCQANEQLSLCYFFSINVLQNIAL